MTNAADRLARLEAIIRRSQPVSKTKKKPTATRLHRRLDRDGAGAG
jgi:hypothetical protein